MQTKFNEFLVYEEEQMIDVLKKIDANKQGFVIVVDDNDTVKGVLTDGDIRRAIIHGKSTTEFIANIYTTNARTVNENAGYDEVTELFKNQAIKFIPILSENGKLINIITKSQMHALLLQDINADLTFDFFLSTRAWLIMKYFNVRGVIIRQQY